MNGFGPVDKFGKTGIIAIRFKKIYRKFVMFFISEEQFRSSEFWNPMFRWETENGMVDCMGRFRSRPHVSNIETESE